MAEDKNGEPPTSEPPSIRVTNRHDASVVTRSMYKLIRPFGHKLAEAKKEHPAGSPQLSPPSSITEISDVHERKVDDIWIYDMRLKKPTPVEKEKQKTIYRIYYFAGGGWQMPPSPSHWKFLQAMLQGLPTTIITVVSYPLAPNSPAPVTIPQLLKLYDTLLTESDQNHETVTLAGDSAGGNIALCLPLEALRYNPSALRPYSIMAICPSADMHRANPELVEIEQVDPILRIPFIEKTARDWQGEWDSSDPRVSPIRADLGLLQRAGVKVDGVTGGYDLLAHSGVEFREKLSKAGVEGEWLQWDKMMHCWPLAKIYGIFPESEEAFQWIVGMLKKRVEDGIGKGSTIVGTMEGVM
jgi:acetyl esterase/lipase